MGVTQLAYLILLLLVAVQRIGELAVSRRNQRRLLAEGAVRKQEPRFSWMVAVHVGILAGAALEVTLLHRPLYWTLAAVMLVLFIVSNALRLWVIRTLGHHWNVRVMESGKIGVVTDGPYRWVRHPNYVAVFVELMALPLIYTAWITAAIGTAAHLMALQQRLKVEDPMLLKNPNYRDLMGAKPRFLPKLF